MKTKHLLLFSSVILAGIFTVWSCKKDDEKVVTKEEAVSIAKKDAVSDAIYNDVYSESEEVLSALENNKYPASGSMKSASLIGSRTITVTKNNGDTTTFPKEVLIIYNGYTSNSGMKKNGTIKITQSAKIRKAGAIRTITLENFSINDTIQIEGKKTITNMGLVDGKPSIKSELVNGKVSFSSGYYITRSFTRTITWVSGFTTLFNIWDDVYSFEETAKGTSKNGFNYNSKTTVPLEYKVGDFCIKKGKIEVNIEGQKKVYLDFTRTDCVSKIKLIFEGEVEDFRVL